MRKVLFSSWTGKIVDNRGMAGNSAVVSELPIALDYDGRRVGAFMSWDGALVADENINIVDMAHSYMNEVNKLSCGECIVGYSGVRAMTEILGRIVSGKGNKNDVDLLKRLGNGIKDNGKCDFCVNAVTPVLDTLEYFGDEYQKVAEVGQKLQKGNYFFKITSPCMEACPAHQDATGYIELIRNQRYDLALKVIRETNCLPGMLGRACVAFCESNCVRGDIDSPIAIRALKRVPADDEITSGSKPNFKRKNSKNKVAVIGAGPAGLAAAFNLALKGYNVTIYDDQPAPGGMAMVGIPRYRLPGDVIDLEIDNIKKLGIDIKLNTRVGKDIAFDNLAKEGFKAVFVATGAHLERENEIEAWNLEYQGLADGIEFLRKVNQGEAVEPGNSVLIIGGGNVAVDCARTCLRLGSQDVTIIYRRSRAEMPGRKEEIEEAEKEGAKIHFLAVPVRVLAENGKVTGAECIKMKLGEPDASGRKRPVPVKGSEFFLNTDMIISAIGEKPDLSFLTGEIKTTDWGTIEVSSTTCQTSKLGIFSGGDCVSGPATLVEAIAAGNKAAKSIDRYLETGTVAPSEDDLVERLVHEAALSRKRRAGIVAKSERQNPEQIAPGQRKINFDEVEKCFTTEEAIEESKRCLRCYRVILVAVTG